MSKVLVVYGTKTGCTTGIAEAIRDALTSMGAAVDMVPADKAPEARGYDAVVVGSGVRMGQWHAAARTWVEKNAQTLGTVPVAFYTCGLTLAQDSSKADEVRAFTEPLIAATGVQPVDVGVFAGWNEPKEFGLLERTVLSAMKAPRGDFRDFDAVAAWTREVAPKLGLGASAVL